MKLVYTSSILWSLMIGATKPGSSMAHISGKPSNEDVSSNTNGPCEGGSCPMPAEYSYHNAQHSGSDDTQQDQEECGLWLGPSPIKEHEEHGFGLGIFTGRYIKKGEVVDPALLFLLQDWNGDTRHPPLREYTWEGDHLIPYSLQTTHGQYIFSPGVGSIAPCTSKNFNLEFTTNVGQQTTNVPHRSNNQNHPMGKSNHPALGSFNTLESYMYVAARDIVAGEEFTVECTDDDFDGGAYFLSRYQHNDDRVTCLDNLTKIQPSTIPNIGKGLFATKFIPKGTTIVSTPLIPMNRNELDRNNPGTHFVDRYPPPSIYSEISTMYQFLQGQIPKKQLLLNYAFGHPQSNLLFVPYAPMVGYINHPPVNVDDNDDDDNEDYKSLVNVKIQWHESKVSSKLSANSRKQHHHSELFEMTAQDVSLLHGKGLVIDIVATQDISLGQELFLDYGDDWVQAWKSHVINWNIRQEQQQTQQQQLDASMTTHYLSAKEFQELYWKPNAIFPVVNEPVHTYSLAQLDQDLLTPPLPKNLQYLCSFESEWEYSKTDPKQRGRYHHFWQDYETHTCQLPCILLHRYTEVNSEDGTLLPTTTNDEDDIVYYYAARLMTGTYEYNRDISEDCWLMVEQEYDPEEEDEEYDYEDDEDDDEEDEKQFIIWDLDRSGIQLINVPYSTDEYQPHAFRHEIGVPLKEEFYPESWLTKTNKTSKLRKRTTTGTMTRTVSQEVFQKGEEYKRKKTTMEATITAATATARTTRRQD